MECQSKHREVRWGPGGTETLGKARSVGHDPSFFQKGRRSKRRDQKSVRTQGQILLCHALASSNRTPNK